MRTERAAQEGEATAGGRGSASEWHGSSAGGRTGGRAGWKVSTCGRDRAAQKGRACFRLPGLLPALHRHRPSAPLRMHGRSSRIPKRNRSELLIPIFYPTFAPRHGEVQERLNWLAWKVSKRQKRFRGSNPLLSATQAALRQAAKQPPTYLCGKSGVVCFPVAPHRPAGPPRLYKNTRTWSARSRGPLSKARAACALRVRNSIENGSRPHRGSMLSPSGFLRPDSLSGRAGRTGSPGRKPLHGRMPRGRTAVVTEFPVRPVLAESPFADERAGLLRRRISCPEQRPKVAFSPACCRLRLRRRYAVSAKPSQDLFLRPIFRILSIIKRNHGPGIRIPQAGKTDSPDEKNSACPFARRMHCRIRPGRPHYDHRPEEMAGAHLVCLADGHPAGP